MPGFDGSGPMGAGPMTGGRRGLCGGSYGRPDNRIGYTPVYSRGSGGGRGMGFRRGYGGRGPGRGFEDSGYGPAFGNAYPGSSTDEMAMLRAEADAIKASLESIQSRIAALEKGADQ